MRYQWGLHLPRVAVCGEHGAECTWRSTASLSGRWHCTAGRCQSVSQGLANPVSAFASLVGQGVRWRGADWRNSRSVSGLLCSRRPGSTFRFWPAGRTLATVDQSGFLAYPAAQYRGASAMDDPQLRHDTGCCNSADLVAPVFGDGYTLDQAYPAIAWLAWVPNLVIAEWVFLRRRT